MVTKLCRAPNTQQCARDKVPTVTEDQEEDDDGSQGYDLACDFLLFLLLNDSKHFHHVTGY